MTFLARYLTHQSNVIPENILLSFEKKGIYYDIYIRYYDNDHWTFQEEARACKMKVRIEVTSFKKNQFSF